MTPTSKAVVEAVVAALNGRDFGRFAELLADDVSWTIQGIDSPLGGVAMDRARVLEELPRLLDLWSDGPRIRIGQLIAEGDWVAMEGDGEGTFVDGSPYENHYASVFEVVDGRVRTMREYMDTEHVANSIARVMAR